MFFTSAFSTLGIILGVLKRGISRCLVVMVSMGWGVVRDSLGSTLAKITFLGVFYCGLSGAHDVLSAFALTEVDSLTVTEENEIFDVTWILSLAIIAVNLMFFLWIFCSLNATIQYLENMNQNSKLTRLSNLRCIIFATLVVSAAGVVVTMAQFLYDLANQEQRR